MIVYSVIEVVIDEYTEFTQEIFIGTFKIDNLFTEIQKYVDYTNLKMSKNPLKETYICYSYNVIEDKSLQNLINYEELIKCNNDTYDELYENKKRLFVYKQFKI